MPVDFLICGTQKGGTSALDAYCRSHEDLLMAHTKEVHFFDNDALFQTGDPDYGEYHLQFPDAAPGKLRGESTPIYMYWPESAERIHRYNPRMKLIAILRNPVDRAYSHWQMEMVKGHEAMPFGMAVRKESVRLMQAGADTRRIYSYIDRGRYLSQLERLWALFGRDQVLVLRNELLRNNPAAVLEAVSHFLEIAPFPRSDNKTVNQQRYTSPMPEQDRAYLQSVFAEEIRGLESALDWDLEDWR